MSRLLEQYRNRLAELAATATVILGIIADTEQRLDSLKKEVRDIYEKIDDVLDKE